VACGLHSGFLRALIPPAATPATPCPFFPPKSGSHGACRLPLSQTHKRHPHTRRPKPRAPRPNNSTRRRYQRVLELVPMPTAPELSPSRRNRREWRPTACGCFAARFGSPELRTAAEAIRVAVSAAHRTQALRTSEFHALSASEVKVARFLRIARLPSHNRSCACITRWIHDVPTGATSSGRTTDEWERYRRIL
jgi:hypothetical protein